MSLTRRPLIGNLKLDGPMDKESTLHLDYIWASCFWLFLTYFRLGMEIMERSLPINQPKCSWWSRDRTSGRTKTLLVFFGAFCTWDAFLADLHQDNAFLAEHGHDKPRKEQPLNHWRTLWKPRRLDVTKLKLDEVASLPSAAYTCHLTTTLNSGLMLTNAIDVFSLDPRCPRGTQYGWGTRLQMTAQWSNPLLPASLASAGTSPGVSFNSFEVRWERRRTCSTGAFNLKRTTPVLNSLRSDSHLINTRWEGKERQRRVFKPLSRNKRCEMERPLNWHVVARCWWKCLAFGEKCSWIVRGLWTNPWWVIWVTPKWFRSHKHGTRCTVAILRTMSWSCTNIIPPSEDNPTSGKTSVI